jgi:hypothetical protein
MSGTRRFVDTNILLYAHDDSAGAKRDRARALPKQLWDSREGCLSVQVLQEFFMNATRKIPTPLSAETAKEIVADLSHWQHARPRSRRRACRDWHPPAGRNFVPGLDDRPQRSRDGLRGALLGRPQHRPGLFRRPRGEPVPARRPRLGVRPQWVRGVLADGRGNGQSRYGGSAWLHGLSWAEGGTS